MRRTRRGGSFFVCLLINMLLNLDGTIPAFILLGLHLWLHIGILWFWLALGAWMLGIVLWMLFVGWASSCDSASDYRPNKNPYSVGAKKSVKENDLYGVSR